MSGFAAVTGEPDGPPTLPPFGLADGDRRARHGVRGDGWRCAHRDATGAGAGRRPGDHRADPDDARRRRSRRTTSSATCSRAPATARSNNAPRNVYRTADGGWVAVSTSSQSIAERVLRLVGRADLVDAAVVRDRARAGRSTPTSSTTRSASGSRARTARRGGGGVRGGARPRSRRSTTSADVMADPQYAALRHRRRPCRRRGARAGADAERAVPAVRDARARSAGPAGRTARTPTTVLAELGCRRRARSPQLRAAGRGVIAAHRAVRARRPAGPVRQGGGLRRRCGDPRPGGRGRRRRARRTPAAAVAEWLAAHDARCRSGSTRPGRRPRAPTSPRCRPDVALRLPKVERRGRTWPSSRGRTVPLS